MSLFALFPPNFVITFRSEQGDGQWIAAQASGRSGDPGAIAYFIAAFRDDKMRKYAIETLAEIGAAAVDPLLAALTDEESDVRSAAAETLGQIGDPRAVDPLVAALRDHSWYIRSNAAEALGRIGDPRAVEPLVALLTDQERDIRSAAAGALGQIGDRRAIEPLVALLSDQEGDIESAAAGALGQIGDPRAAEPLLATFWQTWHGKSDDLILTAVVEALGQIGDPRAAGLLDKADQARSSDQADSGKPGHERAFLWSLSHS